MSLLATVVSEGSPGSSLWTGPSPLVTVEASPELLRARFDDGALSLVCFFDLLGVALAGPVESSPSSPDASREDGWSSVVLDWGTGRWEALRLRLPGGDEGDIVMEMEDDEDGKEVSCPEASP